MTNPHQNNSILFIIVALLSQSVLKADIATFTKNPVLLKVRIGCVAGIAYKLQDTAFPASNLARITVERNCTQTTAPNNVLICNL